MSGQRIIDFLNKSKKKRNTPLEQATSPKIKPPDEYFKIEEIKSGDKVMVSPSYMRSEDLDQIDENGDKLFKIEGLDMEQ